VSAAGADGAPTDVRAMFDRIAGRYRLMNALMTFGRDRLWRRAVVRAAALPAGGRLLDLASGTGDIALEALRQDPGARVTAADFSLEMMRVGRRRPGGERIAWIAADALALPFPDASFDAVTSGYLLRNVADREQAFREQARVVKPGGRVVCLDTSPPPASPLRPLVRLYLRRVIPLLGRLIAGERSAYAYLSASTEGFKAPEELAAIMRSAGLQQVGYQRFMAGTIAVHVGTRPAARGETR
jgi:demethylmenaquinone methyltransferase/2-methoxy-6-polyprenyl-1,4-benzoquinol methylase